MVIYQENIYDQIDHVNNCKNDRYSGQFTERSVSSSDISQSPSENYSCNMKADKKRTNNIMNQTNIDIQNQQGTLQIGDVFHFYTQNGLKYKVTIMMALLLGIFICIFLIGAINTNTEPIEVEIPSMCVIYGKDVHFSRRISI